MVLLSRYAARRLAMAKSQTFGRTVTAYLTRARIIARSGFGEVHEHVRAEASGRFSNGQRVRTSDVMRAERIGGFWVLHTWSGSLYVIVTFDRRGGRRSVDTFKEFSRAELHPTPYRLQ